jgi:hypothetical protein
LNWASSVTAYGFRPFVTAAGYSYKVLASQSGTGPTFYGVEIPLTYDSLVRRSLMGTYPGALEGNHQGTLDSEGNAAAKIRITAGNWPELIGMQYYIAVVAMGATGLPEFSSVAIPILITP